MNNFNIVAADIAKCIKELILNKETETTTYASDVRTLNYTHDCMRKYFGEMIANHLGGTLYFVDSNDSYAIFYEEFLCEVYFSSCSSNGENWITTFTIKVSSN